MKSLRFILLPLILFNSFELFSQKELSLDSSSYFNGSLSVTNNGISLIPTFSLGKPAILSNFSISKKRLSFETDINFADDGKPWYTLFWLRYKLVESKKFNLRIGSHLGLNYKRIQQKTLLDSSQVLLCERYFVTEFAPNYQINKNVSIGIYYMFSHGLDAGTNNANHFLTFNSNIKNLPIGNKLLLGIVPQIYYLKMDKKDGYYFTGSISLSKKNTPISISTVFNKVINTNINPQDDFVYNITLTYILGKHKVF